MVQGLCRGDIVNVGGSSPYQGTITEARSWREYKYKVRNNTTQEEKLHNEGSVTLAGVGQPQTEPHTILVYDKNVTKESWMEDSKGNPLPDPVFKARNITGALGVTSVADMIQKLQHTNRAPFTYITIVGHGAPGGINVGTGDSGTYSPGQAIEARKLNDIQGSLTTLRTLLTDDGVLYLAGCHVGANIDDETLDEVTPSGNDLLDELSQALPGITCAALTKYASPDYTAKKKKEPAKLWIGQSSTHNYKYDADVKTFDINAWKDRKEVGVSDEDIPPMSYFESK